MSAMPRKKGPPSSLRIDTPPQNTILLVPHSDSSAPPSSTLSSANSDEDSFVFPPPKSRSRNMKKLSLTLPSAQSSTNSLTAPSKDAASHPYGAPQPLPSEPRRKLSTLSLPSTTTSVLLHRKDEDETGSPSAPYADGPVQILPGIWLGSEDNARDFAGLRERGIKSILNVAKEVSTTFDNPTAQPLRPFMSTPELSSPEDSTYYPPHIPTGRPGLHYLKLPWSHGQSDLVRVGFPAAMSFVDQASERGDGVLIHCQCGVSRSATLMIALVMRAAVQCSPSVGPEVWALKGMQGAYSFVKDKSSWIGPNMSLIYQLMDLERAYKNGDSSPAPSTRSSLVTQEEEWGRQRSLMDEADTEDNDIESVEIMREARALDKAMEDRIIARKSSASSVGSTGVGMGKAWRNRYGSSRKRTGSVASIITSGSVLSEHLVEEDEERELLGVGGGFTSSDATTEDEASSLGDFSSRQPSPCTSEEPSSSPPSTARLPPPSAPAYKTSFLLPPTPATAIKATFDLPSQSIKPKRKRRPPPLVTILPPVPSSPVTPVVPSQPPLRTRAEGRKPELPPPHLRKPHSHSKKPYHHSVPPISATPSQTLFVFPPSPTLTMTTQTPSTMTLTSSVSFPVGTVSTPRITTFKTRGRPRSFIGLGLPSTPTTASTRVDARGWIGLK